MSAHKPYFTDADLIVIHAILSGAPQSGMTPKELSRVDKVRAELERWAEKRAERKAAQGRGRRAAARE